MRTSRAICIALSLLLTSTSAISGENTFKANFATATKNALTKQGAAYDVRLGSAIERLPDFAHKMTACLKGNPGRHAVHGYFVFSSNTAYRVVLEPKGAFSACLSKALEDHAVPAPPRIPYLNPFALQP